MTPTDAIGGLGTVKALKPIAVLAGLVGVAIVLGRAACEAYAENTRRERTEQALSGIADSPELTDSVRDTISAARRRNDTVGFADQVHRTIQRRCGAISADGAVTGEESLWLAELLRDALELETVAFVVKHPGGR